MYLGQIFLAGLLLPFRCTDKCLGELYNCTRLAVNTMYTALLNEHVCDTCMHHAAQHSDMYIKIQMHTYQCAFCIGMLSTAAHAHNCESTCKSLVQDTMLCYNNRAKGPIWQQCLSIEEVLYTKP